MHAPFFLCFHAVIAAAPSVIKERMEGSGRFASGFSGNSGIPGRSPLDFYRRE